MAFPFPSIAIPFVIFKFTLLVMSILKMKKLFYLKVRLQMSYIFFSIFLWHLHIIDRDIIKGKSNVSFTMLSHFLVPCQQLNGYKHKRLTMIVNIILLFPLKFCLYKHLIELLIEKIVFIDRNNNLGSSITCMSKDFDSNNN